jgi:hypothetical protein
MSMAATLKLKSTPLRRTNTAPRLIRARRRPTSTQRSKITSGERGPQCLRCGSFARL